MDARVAVLVSGSGTNLQALLDDEMVGPRIAVVASDRPGVRALQRAASRDVEALVVDPAGFGARAEHDAAVVDLLYARGVDTVLLAGYMRILGPTVIRSFPDRILNVHPSLLPAFPGAHPVRDALDWGAKVTGATVHLVDEQVDHGPIVAQQAVPVLAGDDEASLHSRIQEVEHRLYPRIARLLLEGLLKVEGRRVHVLEGPG